MKFAILVIACLIGLSACYFTNGRRGLQKPLDFTPNTDYRQEWFVNFVDQVDQTDKRMYKQRFWYSTEEFDQENGPIFLYICGEYTCSIPTTREFPHQLAQKHNGLFLVLEHRYYGDSQPFDDWSVPSLKYLTVENALADTAMFLQAINDALQNEFGGKRRKVVVVGGSYPGAVSAWMRYKYPHVVDASISSSGVVNAILDYDMYDYQIWNSTMKSGGECPGVITNMTQALDMFIEFNNTDALFKVKSIFEATHLSDVDFVMSFSDQFAGKVQYGARREMCDALMEGKYADVFYQFNITRQYFGAMDDDYNINSLKNTTIDINKNMRQWTYQTCAELAYFQTPFEHKFMRSKLLNITYYKDTCEQAFGPGIWPDVHHTNTLLGETHLARTNIFFSNGGEDPWKWAGETSVPANSGMEAQVIDCEDCAHCVELYTPSANDAPELVAARLRIEKWLDLIINEEKAVPVKTQMTKITM